MSETTEHPTTTVQVKELGPNSKGINLTARVVEIAEAREIPNRFGPPYRVAEATVADQSAAVILSLWNDQIGSIKEEDTIRIENGYVSLVRGHIRLNTGKYGRIVHVEEPLDEVNTDENVSDAEHEQERRPRRDRGDRGGGERSYGGGRGGDRGGDRGYGGGSRGSYGGGGGSGRSWF